MCFIQQCTVLHSAVYSATVNTSKEISGKYCVTQLALEWQPNEAKAKRTKLILTIILSTVKKTNLQKLTDRNCIKFTNRLQA